nr:SLOG family protein [uncultured Eisenbergiella sp.]
MNLQQSCCFTGHRPEGLPFQADETQPGCVKLKERLTQEIERLITEEGVCHFITGMALGADQIAAELVLKLKEKHPQITLESAIPYEEQAIKWTVPQRERYYEIAEKCDETTTLQTTYTSDCMKKRNYYMVDHSGFVLAVWSGIPRSGTGQTVRYARSRGRQIIVINPKTLEITKENQLNMAQE